MKTTELYNVILNDYQKTYSYLIDVYFQLKVQDHNHKARTMLLYHCFNICANNNCTDEQRNRIVRAVDSIFIANEYK